MPLCGFCYGAKLYGCVKEAFFFCIKCGTVFLSVCAILGFIFSTSIISIFRHDAATGKGLGHEKELFQQQTGETTRWTNSVFGGMPTYQMSPSYDSNQVLSQIVKAYHLWLPDYVWYVFVYLLGFYIMLRAFNFRQSLAALGSIIWAFSSYFFIIIAAGHIWKVWALAYLPPMIAGVVLAYRGKYLKGLLLTAIFSAFEVQANHVQMTYYYLFIILFMVIAFLVDAIKKGELARFGKATAVCVVGALIGISLNLSNLYHTWQYGQETMRGKSELVKKNVANQTSSGLDRDYITQWSYGIDETWTLMIPDAKGGASVPLAQNQQAMEKADPNFVQIYQQLGQYWGNQPSCTSFTSEVGTCADYYFMYKDGTQDGVIASIRELTGQATMFPKWAMGFWQCRERYKTSDELAGVLDKYRELKIPTDAIVQDWQYWGCDSNWNAMKFQNPYYINKVGDPAYAKYLPTDMKQMKAQGEPRLKSPEEMVKYVHKNDAHLMISIWASFGPWTEQYRELKKMNALLPFETWPKNSGVMPYDVFNPKARNLYWKYLTHLYQMGFDAWWTDSTEPDHFEKPGDENYQTFDGSWLGVKNAFPLLHNKSIYEHQRAMKGNTKRSLQMTRSGSLGIQHYGTICWSGDVLASWNEMKNQIPSGLNFSLCGIPFWNTDLGGFFYWEFEQNPKNPALQELQTRWMQWGTFMPLMRNHCSSPMVSELYEFGKQGDWAYDAMIKAIKLRYRLLPYIYSTAGDCVQNSGSMMRALVMDYAADKKASRLNDEYLFGRNILVKPVTDPLYTWKDKEKKGHTICPDVRKAAAPVNVYLPKGNKWYDFWSNTQYEGGQDIQRLCPIDIMPVFIKAGTILPFGPEVQYSSEKPWDELEIRVYPGADGKFTLYEDEGDNYNYEKGKFSEIQFVWNEADRTLNIAPRKGSYKGMLQHRRFHIVLVDANSGAGDQPMQASKSVEYDGKAVKIQM